MDNVFLVKNQQELLLIWNRNSAAPFFFLSLFLEQEKHFQLLENQFPQSLTQTTCMLDYAIWADKENKQTRDRDKSLQNKNHIVTEVQTRTQKDTGAGPTMRER